MFTLQLVANVNVANVSYLILYGMRGSYCTNQQLLCCFFSPTNEQPSWLNLWQNTDTMWFQPLLLAENPCYKLEPHFLNCYTKINKAVTLDLKIFSLIHNHNNGLKEKWFYFAPFYKLSGCILSWLVGIKMLIIRPLSGPMYTLNHVSR